MNEFNFDKMRNFKAPDEWAEKTIKVVNEKRRARYYQVKRMRIAMACLCLILLCMFSFTFCIRVLGESFITPVNVEETVVNNSDDKYPIKDERENSIWADDEEETENENEEETSDKKDETLSPTQETQEKETVKSDSSKNNDKKEKETQKPTTAKKPQKPDEKPQNKPDKQENKPAVRPTQKPAKPNTDNKPKPTQAPAVEIEPTEAPVENRIVCSTTISKSLLTNSQKVYCRIYSCDEDIYLGDSDLYSLQHLAELYSNSDDSYSVRYYPAKKGVVNKNGEYIAMFYDENGKNLKTFGFIVSEY